VALLADLGILGHPGVCQLIPDQHPLFLNHKRQWR
jgi:hypothetical protein